MNARWNFGIGNKVIAPINKDLVLELWETINQSQTESEIRMKMEIFTQVLAYKIQWYNFPVMMVTVI